MKQTFIIAALALTASSLALGQTTNRKSGADTKAEQEVRKTHSERLKALVTSNVTTLDQIVGDDLVYISPVGKVQTKTDIVHDLKSGALKVSSIEPGDTNVRVYGNTAVVTYLTVSKFMDNGREYDNQVRSTSVYVKRDGRWQLVSQQMTRVGQ